MEEWKCGRMGADKSSTHQVIKSSSSIPRIILVEPAEPANVGAVARVMTTAGLRDLVVVRSQCDLRSGPARWVAHRSLRVLDAARECATLDDAIGDAAVVAGFTARAEVHSRQWHGTVDKFAALLRRRRTPVAMAFVFGSERYGLSNGDLDLCTHVVTIPTVTRRPSLNLSHAVMVACYEVLCRARPAVRGKEASAATVSDIARLVDAAASMIRQRGTLNDHHLAALMRSLRHTLTRHPVVKQDLHVLYKVLEVVSGT